MGHTNSRRELNETVPADGLDGTHAPLAEARCLGAGLAVAPGLSRA